MEAVRRGGPEIDTTKCAFAQTKIDYLGHSPSKEYDWMIAKYKAVKEFFRQLSSTKVQRFLSMVNF